MISRNEMVSLTLKQAKERVRAAGDALGEPLECSSLVWTISAAEGLGQFKDTWAK